MQSIRDIQVNIFKESNMERELSSTAVRGAFSTILDEVQFQGSKYIVSRKGKPAAVLVPLIVYESWKKSRRQFKELVRSFQESSGDNDPDEVMEMVFEAQQAVRREAAGEIKA